MSELIDKKKLIKELKEEIERKKAFAEHEARYLKQRLEVFEVAGIAEVVSSVTGFVDCEQARILEQFLKEVEEGKFDAK